MDRPAYSEICAYVDRELDAAAAARVAYAAARDPETAAQIAQLTKLKSVLGEMHADKGPVAPALREPRKSPRNVCAGLAAGLAFVALLAGALVAERLIRAPAASVFADIGLATHQAWSAAVGGAGSETRPQGAAVNRSAFVAPDLSAARLALQTAEALDYGAGNILHFGYVGTRGCRLSLFVQLRAEAATPAPAPHAGLRTAAWHHKGIGYLAVADGMDEAHFRTIIAALKQYSIEPAPFSAPTESLLAESRDHARPCLA